MRLLGLLLAVVLTACSAGSDGEQPATPSGEPDGTTAPAGLEEVAPGYDESPDGEPPVPDADLDDPALTALLRTRASASPDDACAAHQVTATLEGLDSALGHRYSRIVVRNTSEDTCVIEGVPGIGIRGAWGSTFVPEVTHSDRSPSGDPVSSDPVRLDAGERASSDLEWTGDLAGAESEAASLLVVQLAAGQVPAAVPAQVDTGAGVPEGLDIGQFTTIRLTPFVPAP